MADSINRMFLIYSVYTTNCQNEGNPESTCRLLFALDTLQLILIFVMFCLVIYLIKKDRDDNSHEE